MENKRGMKPRIIKEILRKKLNSIIESITDENVKNLMQQNTIITGGVIASLLLGERIKDYDLYFTNQETVVAVAQYYINEFKKKNSSPIELVVEEDRVFIKTKLYGIDTSLDNEGNIKDASSEDAAEVAMENAEEENTSKYSPVFLTNNAISLSGRVQLIIRFYGTPEEIHKNYDFVHCTNYWTSKDGELVLKKEALECLLSKTLVYQGSLYPICSLFRIRKFIERGWTINAGQIFKMAYQVSKLNLNNYTVLEDQLTGVDTAYFAFMLSILHDKFPDNKYEESYLFNLINKMF